MTTDAAALRGAETAKRDNKTREARAITVVSAAHFVQHFQGLVIPPLFPFLTAALGIGFVELGFALTVGNVVAVASQLPIGFLVDRIGSRLMLLFGLTISAAAFIGLSLSPTYPHLLIAMALLGLSGSVFHPADYAILSAVIPPARIGRAFSLHTFAGFLGNAIAPVTILPIAYAFGLRAAVLVPAAIAILA